MNRFDNWKKELLQLDKRNPFINFKSKTSVPLVFKDLGLLEDELATGNAFQIFSKYKYLKSKEIDKNGIDKDDQKIANIEDSKVKKFLQEQIILSNLSEIETIKSLETMYAKNRLCLQETGINIIFLALGFLKYREGENIYEAPLILTPAILNRKSITSGYSLKVDIDEAEFNPSLLKYLKKNYEIHIPELEENLPTDNSGIDLNNIFSKFKNHIKGEDGWSIDSQKSCVSLFKFQKIEMFKDLENYGEQFKLHPLLVSLNSNSYGEGQPLKYKNADLEKVDPKNIFCTMDYDSSQLKAILEADAGTSFVLQGPPGTGKSQTIANMISQLISSGKKVLFVAQKKVALDVVKEKLKEVGIGNFLLYIDQNKLNNISQQLESNYQEIEDYSKEEKDVEDWNKKIDKLKQKKNDIEDYHRVLKNKQANGMSVFESFSHFTANKEKYPKVDINLKHLNKPDQKDLESIRNRIRRLNSSLEYIDYNIHDNSLNGISVDWTKKNQDELKQKNSQILHHCSDCIKQYNIWHQPLFSKNSSEDNIRRHDIRHFLNLLDYLLKEKENFNRCKGVFDNKFISDQKFSSDIEEAVGVIEKWNRNILKNILLPLYKDDLPYLENMKRSALELRKKLTGVQIVENKLSNIDTEQKFLLSFSKKILLLFKKLVIQFKIYKKISDVCTQLDWKYVFKTQSINNIVNSLEQYISCKESIKKLSSVFFDRCFAWEGEKTSYKNLVDFQSWRHGLAKILDEFESKNQFTECTVFLVKECFYSIENNEHKQNTLKLIEALDQLDRFLTESEDMGMNFHLPHYPSEKNRLTNLKQYSERRQKDISKLRHWLDYLDQKKSLTNDENLKDLILSMDRSDVDLKQLENIFMYNYHREWISMFFEEENDFLKNSYRNILDDCTKKFKKIDQEVLDLSQKKLRSSIIFHSKKELSKLNPEDVRILKHEAIKKKGHKSTRDLFQEIPSVIKTCAPVILMSPVSVSKFLPFTEDKFDTVIFDEASQINPRDAIGSIARAKQVIVVGDSKQLPPTNFFQTEYNEMDSGKSTLSTLESILDEYISAGMKSYTLKWHYRSQHESLIAFSNMKYYDSKLFFAPAPKPPIDLNIDHCSSNDIAIKYVKIEKPEFETERNNSKHEAKVVVNFIDQLISQKDFNLSIGVITFNIHQQKNILELVKEKEENEKWYDLLYDKPETQRLIVKNLENIQGDERDIIIISPGYGPVQGRLRMHFGPLNNYGGERRLNVAITRAKYTMCIFTSLKHSMIDLDRINKRALGVKDLKHFLEYAEKGSQALTQNIKGSMGDYDSPFEKHVSMKLQKLGWDTRPQIGVGKFRIDIGVVHPDRKQEEYLAGIECDGATYHSSATARDRDVVRQDQLEQKGWKILRIWSTDWFSDEESEIRRIDDELKKLAS